MKLAKNQTFASCNLIVIFHVTELQSLAFTMALPFLEPMNDWIS